MSGWKTRRLGDLGRVVTGKTPPAGQPEMFVGSIPFLTPSDMSDDYRQVVTGRTVSANWDPKRRLLLPSQAVAVVCIGATIGKISMTSEPTHTNQQLNSIVVDKERFDPFFVYYALRLKVGELRARAAGAATPILNKTAFSNVTLEVPDYATQRRIASILCAYDDLIEVTRLRMALLADMSQRLFEDIVDRVRSELPDTSVAMDELVDSTLGGDWGTDEPDEQNTHQVRIIRGTDFRRIAGGNFSTCPTRYITPASARKRLLKPYDVVLENSINAKTRAAGTTYLCTQGTIDKLGGAAIAASFCRVFRFRAPEEAIIFHLELGHMHRTGEIDKFQIVATNGIANFQTTKFLRDALSRVKPKYSSGDIRRIVPMLDNNFPEQICVLSSARDLLIPRLVSGELPIAAAELEIEAA